MAIERYLSAHTSYGAKRLKANKINNYKSVFLSINDYEEPPKRSQMSLKESRSGGLRANRSHNKRLSLTYHDDGKKQYYKLTCHRTHRDIITNVYLQHVIDEGKAIAAKTRQRKLHTNNKRTSWSRIIFEYPSTFDTLATDPKKKKGILDDIMTFSKSKDYYKKVGKSWKRGYILYGPPGRLEQASLA